MIAFELMLTRTFGCEASYQSLTPATLDDALHLLSALTPATPDDALQITPAVNFDICHTG